MAENLMFGNIKKRLKMPQRQNANFVTKNCHCGGTTNLRTHLKCKHALLYTHEVKKTDSQYSSKQTCLDGYAKSVKLQHCSEARATAITE